MIAFDINALAAPVTLTETETVLNFEMEEVGEKIKLEKSDKVAKELGQTTLAFFDLQGMGKATQLIYIAVVVGFLVLIFFVVMKSLQPEPDFAKQRREKLAERKLRDSEKKKK